jgi:transposase-like protein
MSSRAPKCPWCAKPMTHVRTASAAAGAPHRHHYECKRCIVAYAELDASGEVRPERARTLHRHPIQTLH